MNSHQSDNIFKSVLWILLSALSFSAMSLLVKELGNRGVPQFQIVFFRVFINLMIVSVLMISARVSFRPASKGVRLLIARGIAGFLGIVCMFYSLTLLPLQVGTLLSWSSPLFVLIFSAVFLRERLSAVQWAAIVGAFVSVCLLLLPPGTDHPHLPVMGILSGLFAAAFGGSAYLMVRAATAKFGGLTIVFYFSLVATVAALPACVLVFKQLEVSTWIFVCLMGIAGTVAQLAMTTAYRYAAASIVSSLNLINVGFSVVIGWLWFGEQLAPRQWTGLAMLALFISLLAIHGQLKGLTKKSTI